MRIFQNDNLEIISVLFPTTFIYIWIVYRHIWSHIYVTDRTWSQTSSLTTDSKKIYTTIYIVFREYISYIILNIIIQYTVPVWVLQVSICTVVYTVSDCIRIHTYIQYWIHYICASASYCTGIRILMNTESYSITVETNLETHQVPTYLSTVFEYHNHLYHTHTHTHTLHLSHFNTSHIRHILIADHTIHHQISTDYSNALYHNHGSDH